MPLPPQMSDDLKRAALSQDIAKIREETEKFIRSQPGQKILDPPINNQVINLLASAILISAKTHPEAIFVGVDDLLFPAENSREQVLNAINTTNQSIFVMKTVAFIRSLDASLQDTIFLALDFFLTPIRIKSL